MEVVEIRNIVRKDTAVFYRRAFIGDAVLAYAADNTQSRRIEFVLEHTATSGVLVEITLLDTPDYPLIPVVEELKKHVTALDRGGKLP
ncbi:MAG TPA: hypothetical protein VMW73_13365 [Spirochaetia bacterium]|nr:hypothetical protein [Spirochaetia bacterium]